MACGRYLRDFGELILEVIEYSIKDYFDFKRAQIIDGQYQHNKFCGVVGVADQRTLEAMLKIFEFRKRRKELKIRLRKNSRRREDEEDSLMD